MNLLSKAGKSKITFALFMLVLFSLAASFSFGDGTFEDCQAYGGARVCGYYYCCGNPDGICPSDPNQIPGVTCSVCDSDCLYGGVNGVVACNEVVPGAAPCDTDCQIACVSTCGANGQECDEACDDGNTRSEHCGDGYTDTNFNYCNSDCTNTITTSVEECDGNTGCDYAKNIILTCDGNCEWVEGDCESNCGAPSSCDGRAPGAIWQGEPQIEYQCAWGDCAFTNDGCELNYGAAFICDEETPDEYINECDATTNRRLFCTPACAKTEGLCRDSSSGYANCNAHSDCDYTYPITQIANIDNEGIDSVGNDFGDGTTGVQLYCSSSCGLVNDGCERKWGADLACDEVTPGDSVCVNNLFQYTCGLTTCLASPNLCEASCPGYSDAGGELACDGIAPGTNNCGPDCRLIDRCGNNDASDTGEACDPPYSGNYNYLGSDPAGNHREVGSSNQQEYCNSDCTAWVNDGCERAFDASLRCDELNSGATFCSGNLEYTCTNCLEGTGLCEASCPGYSGVGDCDGIAPGMDNCGSDCNLITLCGNEVDDSGEECDPPYAPPFVIANAWNTDGPDPPGNYLQKGVNRQKYCAGDCLSWIYDGCEEALGADHECDEKDADSIFTTCDEGETYFQDQCLGPCVFSDVDSLCSSEGDCSAHDDCDGVAPGTTLSVCTVTSYFNDECSDSCGLESDETVCESEGSCDAADECDNRAPSSNWETGTEFRSYCNNDCTYSEICRVSLGAHPTCEGKSPGDIISGGTCGDGKIETVQRCDDSCNYTTDVETCDLPYAPPFVIADAWNTVGDDPAGNHHEIGSSNQQEYCKSDCSAWVDDDCESAFGAHAYCDELDVWDDTEYCSSNNRLYSCDADCGLSEGACDSSGPNNCGAHEDCNTKTPVTGGYNEDGPDNIPNDWGENGIQKFCSSTCGVLDDGCEEDFGASHECDEKAPSGGDCDDDCQYNGSVCGNTIEEGPEVCDPLYVGYDTEGPDPLAGNHHETGVNQQEYCGNNCLSWVNDGCEARFGASPECDEGLPTSVLATCDAIGESTRRDICDADCILSDSLCDSACGAAVGCNAQNPGAACPAMFRGLPVNGVCQADCSCVFSYCGDGTTDFGEDCDLGFDQPDSDCNIDGEDTCVSEETPVGSKMQTYCGNWSGLNACKLVPDYCEAAFGADSFCDEKNVGDACTVDGTVGECFNDCTCHYCGDGIINQPSEECELPNSEFLPEQCNALTRQYTGPTLCSDECKVNTPALSDPDDAVYCATCPHCEDSVINCDETAWVNNTYTLTTFECGNSCGEIIPRQCKKTPIEDYCDRNQVTRFCYDFNEIYSSDFEAADNAHFVNPENGEPIGAYIFGECFDIEVTDPGVNSLAGLSTPSTDGDVVTQTIELKKGLNLISFNVDMPDKSLNSVFASMEPETEEYIQTQDQGTPTYYNGVWYGNTDSIDLSEAYQVNVFRDKTLTVSGTQIPVSKTIPLNTGWNWVPYYPTEPMSVEQALTSVLYNVVKVTDVNDAIVSVMKPGQGYKIKVSESCTLDYSDAYEDEPEPSDCVKKHETKKGDELVVLDSSCEFIDVTNYGQEYYVEINMAYLNEIQDPLAGQIKSHCLDDPNVNLATASVVRFNSEYTSGLRYDRSFYIVDEYEDEATFLIEDGEVKYAACIPDDMDEGCYRGDPPGACVYEGETHENQVRENLDDDPQWEVCEVNSPGMWDEAIEVTCDDFFDNDNDTFVDYYDTDCHAILEGTVLEDGITPLADVRVDAKASYFYNGTNHDLKFITTTDEDGNYFLSVWGNGTYDVIASKPSYGPEVVGDVFVRIATIVTQDFNLSIESSTCEQDCTREDDTCDPTCEGYNGCYYFDDTAKKVCADPTDELSWKQVGMKVEYSPGRSVQCCNGTAYDTPIPLKANLEIDAKNIVTVRRIVMYEGKPTTLVVAVYN